jgi:ankyrin repeat protein
MPVASPKRALFRTLDRQAGCTPLHTAAHKGLEAIVALLLTSGAASNQVETVRLCFA